jgi:hypothetical protein
LVVVSSLELLAGLNWLMFAHYGALMLVGLMGPFSSVPSLALGITSTIFGALHVYLALVVKRGRGRMLQTILGVIGLFVVPIGTGVSVFAFYVCWFSTFTPRFENPDGFVLADLDEPDAKPFDGEDEDHLSDLELAKKLKREGVRATAIRDRLLDRGVDEEAAVDLVEALNLRLPRTPAPRQAVRRPLADISDQETPPPTTRRPPPKGRP